MPVLCSVEWAMMMIMVMIIIKAEILWKVLGVAFFAEIKCLKMYAASYYEVLVPTSTNI